MVAKYHNINKLPLIAFSLFFVINLWAQPHYSFEQISTDQGLPGSNIRKLYQDEIGYVWFGIEAVGLCKYDGASFTILEHKPKDPTSISNNFIWDITATGRNLWIATENGLNFYNRDQGIFYRYYQETIGLTNSLIIALLFDANGNLWVGTHDGLNVIYAKDVKKLEQSNKQNKSDVNVDIEVARLLHNDKVTHNFGNIKITEIYQDTQGRVWVSSNRGVFIYSSDMQLIRHLEYTGNPSDGLIFYYINFVEQWSENTFLIGTDRGMCLYNINTGTYSYNIFNGIKELGLEFKGFNCMQRDSTGIFWFGISEGILVVDTSKAGSEELTYIPEGDLGLTSKTIRDIMLDKSGQVWISTKFGGIFIYKQHLDIFKTNSLDKIVNITNRKEDCFVLSLYAENDLVWIGTKFGGLLKYSLADQSLYSYWVDDLQNNGQVSNRIECIYEDKRADVWIGTPKGLSKLDKNTGEFEFYKFHFIRKILEDSHGKFWVGTQQGVYIFNKSLGTFSRYNTWAENADFFVDSSIFVYTIYEDSKQNVWFGTAENGLYRYSRRDGMVSHFKYQPDSALSLSSNSIRAICEDIRGIIWIGTKHGGLNFYNPATQSLKNLTKADGLPSNTIYSIQSTFDGNLWLGTHNGLSCLNVSEMRFRNFNEGQGLQSNIFENNASTKTNKGFLLFGGDGGLNLFHPDSLNFSPVRLPLAINSVKVNEQEILTDISHDTTIHLKYFQNYIDFEFSLLNFQDPNRNTFRYILEGIDEKWIEAGGRQYVSYSDLKSGMYSFRLVGLNAESEQVSDPIQIDFEISPPYWLTSFAFVIYFVLLLLMFYGIYKLAILRANYSNRLRESKKAVQLSMETNEAKLRFFTNISHEFQSPLALISMPVEKLRGSNNLSDIQQQYVELIRNNTNRLNRLVKQLMYFRRTQNDVVELKVMQGNIVDFIDKVTQPFLLFAKQQNIEFNLRCAEDDIQMWFDPDKIEKIVSNLLMNAFKFTPSGGNVEIWISTSTQNVMPEKPGIIARKVKYRHVVNISVKDSGEGISKEELKNIFNRFYTSNNPAVSEGNGIGLELVKTLVELHGGRINVKSKKGEGSTFTFTLFKDHTFMRKANISQDEIIADKYISDFDYSELLSEKNENVEENLAPPNNKQKPLILIVEDNNDLRKFLNDNLTDYYNVLLADNGKIGYKQALNKMPELIISDVMMPEMNGLELCGKIKSNIITSHIPVILLTRKTEIEDKIAGMESGADDYLEKPFNLQYLILRINNILDSRNKLKERLKDGLSEGKIESQDISVHDQKLLEKCKGAVIKNLSDVDFSVVELGSIVGMSRSQLYRKITALTGKSPAEFIYSYRLAEAKKYLVEENHSVMDIAHLTGFKSPNSFSTVFKKHFGISPKDYITRYGKHN